MNRSEELEGLAEDLATEFWMDGRVEPSAIASECGLTFSYGHYDDYFDGLLERRGPRFHVYINLDSNKSADAPRARFSFAHELGHYFLDWHRNALERGAPAHGSRADFESGGEVEREADQFAASLLLPRERLKKAAARTVNAEEIKRLAFRFGTSLSATAIRCARLDLSPMIVMRWTKSRRAWCWSSTELWRKTGNRAFWQIDRIPDESATRLVLEDATPTEGPVCVRGTTLSSWFPSIHSGWSDDRIFVEECISLGTHGVLTLLRPDT